MLVLMMGTTVVMMVAVGAGVVILVTLVMTSVKEKALSSQDCEPVLCMSLQPLLPIGHLLVK